MSDPSLDRHLLDMYIILSVQHFQAMAEEGLCKVTGFSLPGYSL